MKKLLTILLFFCLTIIIVFLFFSNFENIVSTKLEDQGKFTTYSVLSFLFLVADIILPIPSSLIMILNGKVLGFFGGAALSFLSSGISSSIGFFIGRSASNGLNKFFSQNEIKLANSLFEKYGDLSITLSKAIPILSEAISFLSGSTSITFKRFLLYSLLGNLAVSCLYAFVGNYAGSLDSYIISCGVILITIVTFFAFQFLLKKKIKRNKVAIR